MRSLLLAAASTVMIAGAAQAADVPSQPLADPPAPAYTVPAFSWAGPYVGVHLGYGFESRFDNNAVLGLNSASGFIGGVQAGYNVSFNPVVVGVEGELSYANVEASFGAVNATLDWKGALTGRLGYAADRVMPYLKGGLAFGAAEVTNGAVSDNQTHFGWTLGGGIEIALTDTITTRVEYMYTDLDRETYTVGAPVSAGFEGSEVRLGINYKF